MRLWIGIGVILCILGLSQVLYWPQSDSIQPGVYLRTWPLLPLHLGDIVVFRPPLRTWPFLASIGMDGQRVTFIKEVGALPGDPICIQHDTALIGDHRMLIRLTATSTGIPIPLWYRHCGTVPHSMFVPVGTHDSRSLDGRYYGPVDQSAIVARVTPLWLVR